MGPSPRTKVCQNIAKTYESCKTAYTLVLKIFVKPLQKELDAILQSATYSLKLRAGFRDNVVPHAIQ